MKHNNKHYRTKKKKVYNRYKKDRFLFAKLIDIISQTKKIYHLYIALVLVFIGLVFNIFDEMSFFGLKALFGFVLYLILTHTIIYIDKKSKELKVELTGDPNLSKCYYKYTKKLNSNINFVFCIIASIYFVTISIVLDFVKLNLIGIYSLSALFCVVFLAFVIFQRYIFILLLLKDISKINTGNFYELIPDRTKWFKLLETFSNNCRNIFIILGSLFILLFTIFSPINNIQIIFQDNFSSSQFIPLLCTWIIILIAIVFMVPFSSFIRHYLLQKIYKNLIHQSIENYDRMYKTCKNSNKIVYIEIIYHLNECKYTMQNAYTWIIPVIVSITNFISVVISIIVDLKEIGLLT